MKYVVGGKFKAAITAVRALKTMGITPSICVSNNEEKIPSMPSLKQFAIENNVSIISDLESLKGEKVFFLSVEFDRIIKREHFSTDSSFFNVHFSLLPQFRGTMTSFWPIIFRQKYSGVTIHKIDQGIDTGDIIFQKKFKIDNNYTCRDLYFKYHEVASDLLVDTVHFLVTGDYVQRKQEPEKASSFPRFLYQSVPKDYSAKQLKIMERIDVYNLLRALIFEEFQLPKVDGKSINRISEIPFKEHNLLIATNHGYLYGQTNN